MEALNSIEEPENINDTEAEGQGHLLVVSAHATSDCSGPSYCVFDVSPAFVARLNEVARLCSANGLSEARFEGAPHLWGPAGIEEELHLNYGEVVVTGSGQFWFTDTPKHCGYHVESDSYYIDDLQKQLDDGSAEIVFLDEHTREQYEEDHEGVSSGE